MAIDVKTGKADTGSFTMDYCVFGPEALDTIREKLGQKPGFRSYVYSGYGHAAYDLATGYKERILSFLKE